MLGQIRMERQGGRRLDHQEDDQHESHRRGQALVPLRAAAPTCPCVRTVEPPTPVTAADGVPNILTSVLVAEGAGPVQEEVGQAT